MSDHIRIALDAALGLLLARVTWLAATELVIKPLIVRAYRRVDQHFNDNLPDLP